MVTKSVPSEGDNKLPNLFKPIKIGKLEFPGRLMKSATVETMCTADGFVTDQLIEFYETIARGGTPLIVTGAASFNKYSRGVPHQISVDDDDKIAGLSNLANAVHKYDSKIFVQIYHTARQAIPGPVGREDAQAPSSVYEPSLGVKPRAMSLDEISETIEQFADAAERCKRAGMDGVQIHAAHGYLISSFLTPHTNRRKDQYGGSFENRIRFLIEIYRAVRKRVGDEFPLILKLNGADELPLRKGLTPEELVKVAKRMEAEGIDAVEITAGHYESGTTFSRAKRWNGYTKQVMTIGPGQFMHPVRKFLMTAFAPLVDRLFNVISAYKEGFNLDYAKQFTQALDVPVICVGGFVHGDEMEAAIREGRCDMVSVARAYVADPHIYNNIQYGRERPMCDHCNKCFTVPGVQPLSCRNSSVVAHRSRLLETIEV